MSQSPLAISSSPATDLSGKALVLGIIDPEIEKFEEYFRQERVGGSPITRFEKELLRSYLYWKLTGGV